jgi:deazaflavin-dependent oxidoreductase (nitroreductase family)
MLLPVARWLGRQPWFGRSFRWIVPIDLTVARLSRGRVVTFAAVPALLLTTTGRRTGRPRTTPLLYVPDGDGYVVAGSNWGQPHHPGWALNLRADPRATATVDGRRTAVRASRAGGPERERLWALLVRTWPGYETYQEQADGRQIMVFRLEPTATGGDAGQ